MNKTLKLSEDLPRGYTLELHGCCLKPRIVKGGVFLTGLSISLRYYYTNTKGFVTQNTREPTECLVLARKWATLQLERFKEKQYEN